MGQGCGRARGCGCGGLRRLAGGHRVRQPQLRGGARPIGDLRTLVSAQAAYGTVNHGFYDTLECLQAPSRCIPDYSAAAPVFLESRRWSGTVGYFRRRFVTGPGVAPEQLRAGASPTSVSDAGTEPRIVDGVCAPDCESLR